MSLATLLVQKDMHKDPIEPHNMRVADANDRPVGRLCANRYCGTHRRFEVPGPIPEK